MLLTDKEEVVLNKVVSEVFVGKGIVCQALHKVMMGVCMPWRLHIFALKYIVDEPSPSHF